MLCQIPTRHIVIPQPPPCPGLTLALSLQEGLSCSACTLQWYWSSGNSCVYDGDYFDYYRGIEKGLNRSHVWSFPPTRLSLWGVVWWPYSLFCMNRYAWKLLEKAAIPSFELGPLISIYYQCRPRTLFFFSSMEKTGVKDETLPLTAASHPHHAVEQMEFSQPLVDRLGVC